jgi:hypothetical protein
MEDKDGNGNGKGKDFPVFFLAEHHAMKAYWRWRCIAPFIL